MTVILPLAHEQHSLSSQSDVNGASLISYAYSYPHKSSYRPLAPAISLGDLWRNEDRSRLALYVHIPFCEMRCGFCNLFTLSQPADDHVSAYLETLSRQIRIVKREVSDARFATFAIGGGTPTMLSDRQLASLLQTLESTFQFEIRNVPTSIETSPTTATRERLQVLAEHGVERISLGIQSFAESDTRAIGRPQRLSEVHQALETIRSFSFPILNIDLIYGDPAQTRENWLDSITAALKYHPEEVYLYPLYVRPETGLARVGRPVAEHRTDLYRAGRDLLREQGYEQLSLRCFRLTARTNSPSNYSCQSDGMIGLGCGARSYTRQLHFATRFAVTQAGVRAILNEWTAQSDSDLAHATHGIRLSNEEQRRRFVILNVLQSSGLNLDDYYQRFCGTPLDDFSEFSQLVTRGWITHQDNRLMLTEAGLENSDLIGPMLYSEPVRMRLKEFVQR